MTLTQFRYVLEVSKTGSVNRAASNLFVSQSVLSNAIKTLETELNQKIFYRTTKGMLPTPFGKTFIAYITPIQMHIEQLNTMLNQGAPAPKMTLSIATTGFQQMSVFLGHLIKSMSDKMLRVELIETSLEEAMNLIASEITNIAFVRRWSCYYALTNKRLRALHLEYYPIRSFPMEIVIGPGNPLYHSTLTAVTADMLTDFPCVLYSYIESGPYRDIYDKLNLSVKSRIVTNSRASMYETINESPAYFIDAPPPVFTGSCDKIQEGPTSHPQYRTLVLQNCEVQTEYGWIVRKGYSRTPIEDECIDLVTQLLRG